MLISHGMSDLLSCDHAETGYLHITTDVHNWCSGNFSKIELSTSLDSLKNSASFDIWLD